MNPIAHTTLARLTAALKPTESMLIDFITSQTFLRGKRFSFRHHEFQLKIAEILTDPDVSVVIQKPSQIGISEVIYRITLAWMNFISGYASAVVFPTVKMSNEVLSTRINSIIRTSPTLMALRNRDVDSNSVKMFINESILYALGGSKQAEGNSAINRPIRTIIADEYARCSSQTIESLQSRQRHQDHQSTILFSTPLFEKADIDEEMEKCGVIWEQILKCNHCNHEFFPNFYEDFRVPGFTKNIKQLTQLEIEANSLDLADSFLQCPRCGGSAEYGFKNFNWVNTSTTPNRPKVGIKISPLCMPKYVDVPKIIESYVSREDKVDFHQQVLGLPASKSDTTMDVGKIQFDNDEPGTLNVWGLDLGKYCHLSIASVTSDNIFIHTREKIELKNIREELHRLIRHFNCVAGVVDLMPYSDLSVEFSNKYQNTWTAVYEDPTVPSPEMFKFKVTSEDDALGTARRITINKNLVFDTYVNSLMDGITRYKNYLDNEEVKSHHEAMRRIRNPKFSELRYQWVKSNGNKTQDHWFHSGVYVYSAARIIRKTATSSLPLVGLTSMRLKRGL